MSDTITVKVNRVAGFAPGQEVSVEVDARGNPLDLFWRRRLHDAERDQCCEVLAPVNRDLPEEYEEALAEFPEEPQS